MDVAVAQQHLPNPSSSSPSWPYSSDGLLLYKGLIYVPESTLRMDILRDHHDAPLAGHCGITRTIELITRNYWFPDLAFIPRFLVFVHPRFSLVPRQSFAYSWLSQRFAFFFDVPAGILPSYSSSPRSPSMFPRSPASVSLVPDPRSRAFCFRHPLL